MWWCSWPKGTAGNIKVEGRMKRKRRMEGNGREGREKRKR